MRARERALRLGASLLLCSAAGLGACGGSGSESVGASDAGAVAPPAPVLVAAPPESGMPAWHQGVAVGEWRQIAGTAMQSAPVAVKTFPGLGNTGPSSKVVAWTGLAIDTRDSSLYSAANGGHMDYAGNEVNRIRLSDNRPAWTESLASTPSAQVVASATHYADGRPTSRHSYYGEVVNEQRNRVMILAGSRFGSGYIVGTVDGFNPTTNSWDAARTYPDGPPELSALPGAAIVEHKATGDVYAFADWNVLRWSNASNSWTRPASSTGAYGYYSASAFDSRRNRILVVGGNADDRGLYDLATNSVQKVSFSGPEAASLGGDGNGMVYDPMLDAFLLRKEGPGSTVYRIDAQTFGVGTFASSGGSNLPSAPNGVWKRFIYVPALKGVVYVPTYTDDIWFLRTN